MNALMQENPETSYFLGALLGDGFVGYYEKRSQYVIGLSVKDKEFIEEFNKCASIALGKEIKRIKQYNGMYRVTYSSKEAASLLKDKPWKDFVHIYEKHPAEFVRGFFDADGCVQKDGAVFISNTNKEIILFIQDLLLRRFNIRSNITTSKLKKSILNEKEIIPTKPYYYQLYLVGIFSKLEFGRKIGSTITRKAIRFRKEESKVENTGKLMPQHLCKCGKRIEYDIVTGRFREVDNYEQAVLKIRCSNLTKEHFKKMKQRNELPSYESLLQMLMSLSGL